MFKKIIWPSILTIIFIGLGITSILVIKNNISLNEITIKMPAVSKVNKDSNKSDLKTIIHEAEKSVIQIEGVSDHYKNTGSGFLFNDKGDIITNAHVVKDTEVIYVRTTNARTYLAAVVGISKETDIAVIRVPELADHPSLKMDKETSVEVGDDVLALGSPHGFQNTATIGIVSGLERNFSVDGYDYENAYQISAQITEGNSGGPLLKKDSGIVIGINSVGTEDGTIGFSIPINEVFDLVHKWSDETENDQLEFSEASILDEFDPEELEEDANYMIEYFFDAIQLRDYVNAYTLLGSDLQGKTSYSSFREEYIQTIELDYSDLKSELLDDNFLKTTVDVKIEQKLLNKEKTEVKNVTYVFVIGFENDQVKIIDVSYS